MFEKAKTTRYSSYNTFRHLKTKINNLIIWENYSLKYSILLLPLTLPQLVFYINVYILVHRITQNHLNDHKTLCFCSNFYLFEGQEIVFHIRIVTGTEPKNLKNSIIFKINEYYTFQCERYIIRIISVTSWPTSLSELNSASG